MDTPMQGCTPLPLGSLLDAWVTVLQGALDAQKLAAEGMVRWMLAVHNAPLAPEHQLTCGPELVALLVEMANLALAQARVLAAERLQAHELALQAAGIVPPGGYTQ